MGKEWQLEDDHLVRKLPGTLVRFRPELSAMFHIAGSWMQPLEA